MRIKDFFEEKSEFSQLLATAMENAHTDYEKRFVSDVYKRFCDYGDDIFLTEKSVNKLIELQKSFESRKF